MLNGAFVSATMDSNSASQLPQEAFTSQAQMLTKN